MRLGLANEHTCNQGTECLFSPEGVRMPFLSPPHSNRLHFVEPLVPTPRRNRHVARLAVRADPPSYPFPRDSYPSPLPRFPIPAKLGRGALFDAREFEVIDIIGVLVPRVAVGVAR